MLFMCSTVSLLVFLGGWTLSNSFPAVAADPNKRLRFARECVGLIADYGFDGIVSNAFQIYYICFGICYNYSLNILIFPLAPIEGY